MNLTKEQQEIYDGKQGATLAKVMQTLVRYGELFGADGMVPVTSKIQPSGNLFRIESTGAGV